MLKNKLTLLPLLATSAAVMGENEQPNILFCIADDASRESFGAYGGRNCNTPAIDALASEGVVFTNAYTQNPKSAPSRACILTGKYSWQLKEATNHFPHFPAEFTLYPQVLMENGYYVGYTGKGWGPGTYDTKDNPAGPEYNKATWEAKNLEIENRIKTITEGITGSNLVESEANAQKAVAEWNSAMAKAEVDQATKETAIQTIKQNLINMQAEGALKIVGKDLSVAQARMIEREMQLLGYRAVTERMSAEAAKKQAENTADKIIKDYERSGQKLNIDEKNSLREWIYGGIKILSSFIPGK